MTETQITDLVAKTGLLEKEIHKRISGQNQVIRQLLVCYLAGGHALLEGVPGLAKTLMVRTLADAVDLSFKRVQFTPDLMPADILGTEVLEENTQGQKQFRFIHGPIFSHIVLADEINRTPPKTQAALLEAMQERSVSYAGTTHELPKPFFLLATQNPIEQSGTFPLPEAQLDRFLMFISVAYPSESEELEVLKNTTGVQQSHIHAVITGEELLQLQILVREVVVAEEIFLRINKMVRNTRPGSSSLDIVNQYVQWGAGPRAGQALILCAKALALIKGRLAVTPEDVEEIAYPVLRHRILLSYKANAAQINVDAVIAELLKKS